MTGARTFEASARGRTLARVRAWATPGLRDRDGVPAGAVGALGGEDAQAVAAVLDEAVAWLGGEGRRLVLAPMNGDIWRGYRATTRGFDLEAHLGEPRTPPEHAEWLLAAGFAVRQRWHSFELAAPASLEELAGAHAEARRSLEGLGYHLQPFDETPPDVVVARLHRLLGRAFDGFLGYTPLDAASFRAVVAPALPATLGRASVFVAGPGGDAGFAVAFRDVARPRPPRALLHLGGLVPEARGRGVARGTLGDVLSRLRALDLSSVLVTLVAEGSPMRRLFGRFAEDRRREYALFERRV